MIFGRFSTLLQPYISIEKSEKNVELDSEARSHLIELFMDLQAQFFTLVNKRVFILTSYGVAGFLTAFIIVASSKTLSDLIGIHWLVALHHEETGVYTDCTKRENRDKTYCQPKVSRADQEWHDMARSRGKSAPFTLHNE